MLAGTSVHVRRNRRALQVSVLGPIESTPQLSRMVGLATPLSRLDGDREPPKSLYVLFHCFPLAYLKTQFCD